jgi:hypothetical protein
MGEPWLDVGYMSPQWRIAEWSLMILPPQFTVIVLTSMLVATFFVVRQSARDAQCAVTKRAAIFVTLGAGLGGLANATLFWVVCCATPTWIVALAMLGVSVSVAFVLEPLGPLFTIAGLALLVWATLAQLRAASQTTTRSEASVPMINGVPVCP